MMERIALGIISVFGPTVSDVAYTYEGKSVGTDRGDGNGHYRGMLASVAPMECLMDLAQDEGLPVTKIVYLCSEKSRQELHALPDGSQMSAEEYFRHAIYEYFQASHNRISHGPKSPEDTDFFVPLDYQENDPTESLRAITNEIGPGKVLVDVETTGGKRDASVLATMAIQVIKTRYSLPASQAGDERCGLGNTVYANLFWREKKGDITRQDATYDLIDLINAIEAFAGYGKAQPLVEFFRRANPRHDTSKELIDLLESMRRFSDDLALCNVADIPESVGEIFSCMRRLRQLHAGKAVNANRAELLFTSLLDGLEADFVPDIGSRPSNKQRAEQTIQIIRWCVSRQLLQQALSLSYELYPKCMWQLGYLDWGVEGLVNYDGKPLYGRKRNEEMIARVEQLAYYSPERYALNVSALDRRVSDLAAVMGTCSGEQRKRGCTILFAREVANSDFVRMRSHVERQIPAMLAWYLTLVLLRNETMHANSGSNRRWRNSNYDVYKVIFTNAEEVRCRFDDEGTLDALSSDILKAMDALEGKIVLDSKLRKKEAEPIPKQAPKQPKQQKPREKPPVVQDPQMEALRERVMELSKTEQCAPRSKELGPIVLWEDLFPTKTDEPNLVRSERQTKESFIAELVSGGDHAQSMRSVSTILVNDDVLEQAVGGSAGCVAARDYLVSEVVRERSNTIAFDEARLTEKGKKLLTRKAVGIGKNSRQTIHEKLCTVYPELFKMGAPAVRVSK